MQNCCQRKKSELLEISCIKQVPNAVLALLGRRTVPPCPCYTPRRAMAATAAVALAESNRDARVTHGLPVNHRPDQHHQHPCSSSKTTPACRSASPPPTWRRRRCSASSTTAPHPALLTEHRHGRSRHRHRTGAGRSLGQRPCRHHRRGRSRHPHGGRSCSPHGSHHPHGVGRGGACRPWGDGGPHLQEETQSGTDATAQSPLCVSLLAPAH